jgi:CRISPR-associated protein Cas1
VIKRTIEISSQPLHLAVQRQQLLLKPPGPRAEPVASIPCEDIGLVVVDHPQSSYTHAALAELLDAGAALVVCNHKHLPTGVLLPFANHTEVVWRLQDQIALPKPARKRLWQQIVVAKIKNQAAFLDHEPAAQQRLRALARTVRSGDPANVEAQAARVYLDSWLDEQAGFQRRWDGGDIINILLNYGYAVMRAAVARTLVGAGLHPALGFHHSNRSNAFCLADDFVEPLRPFVDAVVRDLVRRSVINLDRSSKAELLGLLAATVRISDTTGPLMVALHRSVASLARCIGRETTRLELIEPCRPGDDDGMESPGDGGAPDIPDATPQEKELAAWVQRAEEAARQPIVPPLPEDDPTDP